MLSILKVELKIIRMEVLYIYKIIKHTYTYVTFTTYKLIEGQQIEGDTSQAQIENSWEDK